ncbi:deoxyribodipyrimidine photo-lyase [Halorientalis persicus]|uniref:Deoxyribodipyrimidine photo-lyase n=1 Tax=Halorientalis persicus TaxID=1367881 RepID=A0A1H8VE56_9EURY|nr:FAD-binding domain-containing protein [Halorientalis persicus]SEP13534.1 deoxyribodipyrimidine photo-lyase [Halorientalis persicus]
MSEPRIAVWHRDDLRVRDNAALDAAVADGHPCPIYVVDPQFYRSGMACDARLQFVDESVDDLRRLYRDHGSDLALCHGDPEDVLDDLPVDRIYVNRSVTGRYGRERDERLFDRSDVRVFADDGIDWTDRGRDEYDWSEQAEAYFERDPTQPPGRLPDNPIESETSVAAVEREYGVESEKTGVPEGGASAGRERLTAFADAIADYPGSISPPAKAERNSSRLSPYLAVGCLTPRQVYRYVHENARAGTAREMFTSRLFWNRHYNQKLADWPGWMERAVNPVYTGLFRDRHDPELVAAWKDGRTGYPLVDASMRALRQTGWLNFRMRAMCATFYTYILQCWWKVGADHFYRHLIDADAAINYTQWQSQSALTGVSPVRIYNPRKQVRENDPEGEFVRQYVPELREFPTEHLDQPEKAPLAVQDECDVRIGEDYPRPVVELEARRERAREVFGRLADRAAEALSDPEIRRRASLSRRGGDRQENGRSDGASSGQSRLNEF